jgi:hypothetical protein
LTAPDVNGSKWVVSTREKSKSYKKEKYCMYEKEPIDIFYNQ